MIRDTRLVFLRALKPTLANPVLALASALQPLLFLVLFGPLLTPNLGDGDAWRWFVPGLLVQMALFGCSYAGYAIMPELKSGVFERMRVTPVKRGALMLGRILRDLLVLIAQCGLLLVAAIPFGFRAGPLQILTLFLLAALTGAAIAALSYSLALKVREEYILGPILGATVIPLLLLSGALIPMDNGPTWLYILSRINPLSYSVDAVRSVISHGALSGPALIGLVVVLAMAGLATALCTRVVRAQAN